MLDAKDLEAIAQLMDSKLKPVHNKLEKIDARLDKVDARLDKVESDLEILKEHSQVTRDAVNTMLDWADDAAIQVVPLFRRKV